MFPGPQDHTIDRVFVQLKQPRRGPYTDTLGRVMDDLANRLG